MADKNATGTAPRVKSRQHIIDFIAAEADHQGYKSMNLSRLAGYSQNYLSKASASGAMSVQAAVDFIDTLGFELVIVPRDDT